MLAGALCTLLSEAWLRGSMMMKLGWDEEGMWCQWSQNKATLRKRGKKKVIVGEREEERRRRGESSREAGGSGVFQQWQGRQDVWMDAGAWATSTDIEEPRPGWFALAQS